MHAYTQSRSLGISSAHPFDLQAGINDALNQTGQLLEIHASPDQANC